MEWSCLGWDSKEMTAGLMEWSDAALMSYGGGCDGEKMQNKASLWKKLERETWGEEGQNGGERFEVGKNRRAQQFRRMEREDCLKG